MQNTQRILWSRKIQPKSRLEAYVIIKKVGPNNFVLGDMATGAEITSFAQPVHADRLVPLEVAELATPLESQTKLVIEGREGEVLRQSLDGRVLIRLSSQAEEETFAGLHRRLGARLDAARGVWVDLARFVHDFSELDP